MSKVERALLQKQTLDHSFVDSDVGDIWLARQSPHSLAERNAERGDERFARMLKPAHRLPAVAEASQYQISCVYERAVQVEQYRPSPSIQLPHVFCKAIH